MKIGIDASRLSLTEMTGVEWYTYHLIEEMKKQMPPAVEVILYTSTALPDEITKNLPENWSEKILHWPLKRLWTHTRFAYEMLVHRPDVLFVPGHIVPVIHPKKTVTTIHDIAAARVRNALSGFQSWYTLFAAKRAVNKLPQVIVPSAFTKQELCTYFKVSGKNITVIEHGIDTFWQKPVLTAQIEIIKKQYHIAGDYFVVLGRIEEKKNILQILKAYTTFRQKNGNTEVQLVFIGKDGFGASHIHARIKSHPYAEDILVLGWIPTTDMKVILAGAQGLLFASLYEGFGLPVLEALAVQTPAIVSKGLSFDTFRLEGIVRVDPTVSSEIATAMQLLSEHKITVPNTSQIFTQFSWQQAAKKTIHVLLSV